MFVWNTCGCPMFRLSSRAAHSHKTMLITVKTRAFLTGAAEAALVSPSRHNVDETCRPGYVVALTGRRAS